METYTNIEGVECVKVVNDDGTTWSGLKSAYEEQLEAAKNVAS